jgi:hypothetical protein
VREPGEGVLDVLLALDGEFGVAVERDLDLLAAGHGQLREDVVDGLPTDARGSAAARSDTPREDAAKADWSMSSRGRGMPRGGREVLRPL